MPQYCFSYAKYVNGTFTLSDLRDKINPKGAPKKITIMRSGNKTGLMTHRVFTSLVDKIKEKQNTPSMNIPVPQKHRNQIIWSNYCKNAVCLFSIQDYKVGEKERATMCAVWRK